MNRVIDKTTSGEGISKTESLAPATPFYPAVDLYPAAPTAAPNDAIQVEDLQTLPDWMTEIREDCSENSMLYVLRSNTGHDGE